MVKKQVEVRRHYRWMRTRQHYGKKGRRRDSNSKQDVHVAGVSAKKYRLGNYIKDRETQSRVFNGDQK